MGIIESIQATARTLDELVKHLAEEKRSQSDAVRDILLINHPVFIRLRTLLNVPYRVFFTTRTELVSWLQTRGYVLVEPSDETPKNCLWKSEAKTKTHFLRLDADIFDESGRLKSALEDEWDDHFVALSTKEKQIANLTEFKDDDIPF